MEDHDDAVLVLAADSLNSPAPLWNPADPIAIWLTVGKNNAWIRRACDPTFTRSSFAQACSIEDLASRLTGGSWCLGQAFWLRDICFINQVDGGDEWLVVKENIPFESLTARASAESGRLLDFIRDVLSASVKDCRDLNYGHVSLTSATASR
jgi:hypothetical protein